ncbi:MAG: hypothetical protein JW712_01555 [Dehalococcoidales bacterium]|nr:hypothetical protein [Dehalococcoidales bacterium]
MSILVQAGLVYIPAFIKKKKLTELFRVTAEAFQSDVPDLKGLSFDECLKKYAAFTRDKAEEAITGGKEPEIKKRLYDGAFIMAGELKRSFRANSEKDVIMLARLVYKLLGIDFRCDTDGRVIIKRCFFSSYYSGEVCSLISSLDEGLMEGLSGGTFGFSRRITEGNDCCRASLSFGRSQS